METTKLGDVLVEKGVHVLADTMSLHYDKAVWGEDADEFHPERYLHGTLLPSFDFFVHYDIGLRYFSRWESTDRQTALSWIPFGAGPRTCIGMRLALIEEKLTMARLLRDYDIIACSETEVRKQ
jgi:cytochrome P450 family 13